MHRNKNIINAAVRNSMGRTVSYMGFKTVGFKTGKGAA
jgi:hypothetical protein